MLDFALTGGVFPLFPPTSQLPRRCFTGVVTDAYGDNKWARTTEWAKRERVDLANCYFYTDSVSDRKCVCLRLCLVFLRVPSLSVT